MKKFLLGTLLFWLVAFTSQAQINNLAPVWANVFSGGGTATGNKVAIGADGNVYTIGTFTGTVDFDPSAGVANRTSNGNASDVFVVATNLAGNFLWVQVVANSTGADVGTGIAVSPTNGDIYVCGWLILNSFDIFVTRLTAAGGVISATRTIGGTNSDLAQSLCIDNQGNVIVVGAFEDTVNFGAAVGNLICSSGNLGDTFILKLNADLVSTWVRGYGGDREESTYGVVTDASNDIYFTLGFRSVTIAFGATTLNNFGGANGNIDIAVVKLSANGNNVLWASRAGGTGQDRGLSIALGANGGLYCTGEFSGNANFGGAISVSNGGLDVFISSLNPLNGNFLWTRTFGGAGNDIPRRILLDNASNVHTVGTFVGTVNFDPNSNPQNSLTGTGTNNGFVSRLNANGNFLSANQISSNGSATANGVALDVTNRIYVTGGFTNTVRLNPSNATLNNVTSNIAATYTAVYAPFVCAVTINPTTLPNSVIGGAYNQTLTQTGSTSAQTWTITSGALPAGLTLDGATGVISGTTNVLGTFTFTVSVGGACSGTSTYTIVVACPTITIFPQTVVIPLDDGVINTTYTQTFTQTGLPSAVWAVSAGTLPARLTLNTATGVLSGTPTQAGNFCFAVQVSDSSCSQTKEYCIAITCPKIVIGLAPVVISQDQDQDNARPTVPPVPTTPATPGAVGVFYAQALIQTGLISPIWSIAVGTLPAGLSLNATTGVVSGTPTTSGTFCFTIQVASQNCSQTRAFCITIACPTITINPTTLPNGSVCTPYTQQMSQTGSSGSVVWSITSGTLPPGLTLAPNTGLLNGTPTSVGTFDFTISASSGSCNSVRNYTVVISCAPATPTPIVLDFPIIMENCVGSKFSANVMSSYPKAGIITYLSSDISIAEVDSDGKVTIVGTGYVCITALQVISGGTGVFVQKCFDAVNCMQQQPNNPTLKNQKNEVNLYPNPTDGIFEVEFTKSMGTLNVEVANVAGVVVLKETFTKKTILENANETIKLNISTLPAGLYLVKWSDGTTSGTKKVVKK